MAGVIKVDRVQSDSNLAFNIAGANVAFMDASALRMVGSNIVTNGTTIVSGSKIVNTAQPAGAVLQVVQAVNGTQASVSNSTWVTTGLAASITPLSSSSKILARFSPNIYFGSTNSIGCGLRIDRAGTTVYTTALVNNVSAIVMLSGNYCIEYLDSPATTSSVTYTLQFNCPFANSPYKYPTINSTDYNSYFPMYSTVTLMEIAA